MPAKKLQYFNPLLQNRLKVRNKEAKLFTKGNSTLKNSRLVVFL